MAQSIVGRSTPTLQVEPQMDSTTIHLIYIHGFRGDHTTFQAFPTDLHKYLIQYIPTLQTHVYPTYKSSRPLALATANFLTWLATLPPGRVILAGHSMGGLLAAEAATDSSSVARRVMAVLAFDTPFLSIHPHVVISGIASLLPEKKEDRPKPEHEVNDPNQVNMVSESDAYPLFMNIPDLPTPVPSPNASVSSLYMYPSGSLSTPSIASSASQPSLSPSNSSLRVPSVYYPRPASPQSPKPSFIENTLAFFEKAQKRIAEDPFAKWLKKHSDKPFSAMTSWVVHQFEFGSCMFDPQGLQDRYHALERWGNNGGLWINLYTVTVQKGTPVNMDEFERAMAQAVSKSEKKELQNQKKEQEGKKPRHFVTIPHSSRDKWVKVAIAGVDDEVAAHCGIFIRDQNLEYEAFIRRVGKIVRSWVNPQDDLKDTDDLGVDTS